MKKVMLLMSLVLSGCLWQQGSVTILGEKEVKVSVEIARTQEEIAAGLMYRSSLDKNSGMLFVFEDESERVFWMKNTKIPLDMIFISENGTIVNIRHAVPCTSSECPLYPSVYPAKYVLEVNGNFAAENGISIGDFVSLD